MDRMHREQFFARMADLDEERLKKALWNLYWRGTATVRQRIEAELEPDGPRPRRKEPAAADPDGTLSEVREFVALARSGAYLAGDRRVSPRDRTRWRFTFQQLVKDTGLALRDDEIAAGAEAMGLLIDLAQECAATTTSGPRTRRSGPDRRVRRGRSALVPDSRPVGFCRVRPNGLAPAHPVGSPSTGGLGQASAAYASRRPRS
jgi:hypothetical protein